MVFIIGVFIVMVMVIVKLDEVVLFVKFFVKDFLVVISVGVLEEGGIVFDFNYVEDSVV